ncbi:MAG: hypothetical protein HMLKMBBP_01259 [Planctomycetes bacterium]|nr:hypothetical protein [Planctomycetota bacterium]
MSSLVLQHCQPVTIFASEIPADLELSLQFAGTGSVQIICSPNAPSPPGPAAPGVPYSGTVLGCTLIRLHYVKEPLGPDTMTVDFEIDPA